MFCKYDFFYKFESISHDYKCKVNLLMLTCLVFEVYWRWKEKKQLFAIFPDRIMAM